MQTLSWGTPPFEAEGLLSQMKMLPALVNCLAGQKMCQSHLSPVYYLGGKGLHQLPNGGVQLDNIQSIDRIVKMVTEASSKYFSQGKDEWRDQVAGDQQDSDVQGWV